MKIALVSEGTYPYEMGGVSVWCDQLIRGLSDCRWEFIALTVDGNERMVWDIPDNLEGVRSVPLWDPLPTRGRPGRRELASSDFAVAYRAFITAVLTPLPTDQDHADGHRQAFIRALRGLFDYGEAGGDLGEALTSNTALELMMDAWRDVHADDRLTLADALEAASLLEHMLRPLRADVVSPDTDIVHASMNGLSMLVGLAAKWRHGMPVIMSEHGIYLRERYLAAVNENARHGVKVLVLSFFRALAGAGYAEADVLAPHSSYNRRWQLQHGGDADRMWTMYNGVSLTTFPVAETEPEIPTIVFMGRIDPLKDLHTLIRAFAIIREDVPDAVLKIFGGTPAGNEVYRDSCLRLIDELGLGDSATLEGRVDSPIHAYHAGSLVALTSISEGFPYTVVEAMACGRTVVCTNVGGVAEAVGETGFVVPARDERAVAAACVRLLRYRLVRQRMAAAARERIVKQFTLEHSLDAYRSVYRHVMREDSAAPAVVDPDLDADLLQPAPVAAGSR